MLRTPRGGRAADVTVIAVLPTPSVPLTGPAALADPAVADFLQKRGSGDEPRRLDLAGARAAGCGDSRARGPRSDRRGQPGAGRGRSGAARRSSGSAARRWCRRARRAARSWPSGWRRAARRAPGRPARRCCHRSRRAATRAVRQELLTLLAWLLDAARSFSWMLRAGFGEELQRIAPAGPRAGASRRCRRPATRRAARLRAARTILDARIRAVPPLPDVSMMSADRIAAPSPTWHRPGRAPVRS